MNTYRNCSDIKVSVIREKYDVGRKTECVLFVDLRYKGESIEVYAVSGYARLKGNDTYDESIGKRVAKSKAIAKAYNKAARKIRDIYRNNLEFERCVDPFMIKSNAVILENKEFVKKW